MPTQYPIQWALGLISWGYSDWSVEVTVYFHVLQGLKCVELCYHSSTRLQKVFLIEARVQFDLTRVCVIFSFSGRGPRDEPARDDGGPVTRFGPHHERRAGGQ